MKCPECDEEMEQYDDMKFQGSEITGWKCQCGRKVYDSERVQEILANK